ncbi:surfeit locus protein [Irineochytrium annulatum]|nr:surfeit locus protein [Irineochytrium annulatum]
MKCIVNQVNTFTIMDATKSAGANGADAPKSNGVKTPHDDSQTNDRSPKRTTAAGPDPYVLASDADYIATTSHSLIPPPRLEPPAVYNQRTRRGADVVRGGGGGRDRGGDRRDDRGGGARRDERGERHHPYDRPPAARDYGRERERDRWDDRRDQRDYDRDRQQAISTHMAREKNPKPAASSSAAPSAVAVSSKLASKKPKAVEVDQAHTNTHAEDTANAKPKVVVSDRLLRFEKSFEALIDMIPTKYYLPQEDNDETYNKFAYNKKNKAPKQAIKEATKKAKKLKFDPEAHKSVSEIQSEQMIAEAATKTHTKPNADLSNIKPLPSGSIVEIREKYQARMASFAAKRNGQPQPTGSDAGTNSPRPSLTGEDGVEGPRSRQEILEKRMKKRKEKKEKRLKKKEKRKDGVDTKGMAVVPKAAKLENPAEDISFGVLDFHDPSEEPNTFLDASKRKRGPTDPAALLKKSENKKAKLEALKESNPEKAATIEEKEKWGKLMKMAEGETVKDDTKLLKKTLKRKEKVKEKSGKEWESRRKDVQKSQVARQQKRTENLKARSESKKGTGEKGKKGTKDAARKKRPGFEGGVRKRK